MKRRTFIVQGTIITGGLHLKKFLPFAANSNCSDKSLYDLFKTPGTVYYPFVRWWWNGDKVKKNELARELRLLKQAGISGVEINPIKFPERTNDLGMRSISWLSDEWTEMLGFTFAEAKTLGMTCDLIVGSGWPFGAEWLEGDERSQIVVIGTRLLNGPLDYEVSLSELFKDANPPIYSPYEERKMEMLAVTLVPAMFNSLGDVRDLSDQIPSGSIKFKLHDGNFVLYALIKIDAFMKVIQGAPGAAGPVLNHYSETAVKKYLARMSSAIQERLGPLSTHLRALFVDSLELEGSNWCEDICSQFQQRRGYDITPWLPFILYKITAMGNSWLYEYGAKFSADLEDTIERVRYDFEVTKAELLRGRFFNSVISWCKTNNVLLRMQAYGRGYFPLEGSFGVDIPECETWIRPGLGVGMNEDDYRIGRAYTMVNKYVSSAAHLEGKKHISCEELTNIHMVFNESLELMKIATDQSIISGVTHSVLHGFNYSPPEALFPGWVIYGSFINERTPWWNYFHYFTEYKARLSAVLQQAIMFADIAILPATADLWSIYGAQNDPFPVVMHPSWQTLIWESIHQNGNSCDYISESVIQDSEIKNGYMHYGPRKYHTIFLTQVLSMEPVTAKKLFDFVQADGRIFCIESSPDRSSGWKDHQQRDQEVMDWVTKMKEHPDRFIILKKPADNFTAWFHSVQEKYKITPYVKIESPNPFVSQVRYQVDQTEILIFVNSNMNDSHEIKITPASDLISGKQCWIWDPESCERFRLMNNDQSITLDMGPADLKLIVFDNEKQGPVFQPVKTGGEQSIELKNSWSLTGQHVDGKVVKDKLDQLKDLKDLPQWIHFCGSIVYRTNFEVKDVSKVEWLNLGKVHGVSELTINGKKVGTKWYGRRIYPVKKFLKNGDNDLELKVTTTMGNYLKSLTDNPIAQFWTNQGRTIQPMQSIGLAGPVIFY